MAKTEPIIVNPSSTAGQAGTAARYLLTAAGAWAIGKGYITDQTLQAITTLVTIIAPAAYGMWRTYHSKRQLVVAADAAPNSVARVQA
jgi:hypothetical protein